MPPYSNLLHFDLAASYLPQRHMYIGWKNFSPFAKRSTGPKSSHQTATLALFDFPCQTCTDSTGTQHDYAANDNRNGLQAGGYGGDLCAGHGDRRRTGRGAAMRRQLQRLAGRRSKRSGGKRRVEPGAWRAFTSQPRQARHFPRPQAGRVCPDLQAVFRPHGVAEPPGPRQEEPEEARPDFRCGRAPIWRAGSRDHRFLGSGDRFRRQSGRFFHPQCARHIGS